jgi:hypothetical protein
MNSRQFLFLILIPAALVAQDARDVIPLKNWSNPLFWRANEAEREATGAPAPQIQFSGSQVSPNALSFVAITPCRLLDTRGTATGFSSGAPYNAPIAAAGTLTIPVQTDAVNAACGTIPSIAQAYSVNITLIPVASGQVNYLSIWPAGATQPVVATMNDKTGLILANAAIVPAGTPSGGVSVYNSGPSATNVVIDMNGFFAAPSDLNNNTAIGVGTLANNTGTFNTAVGTQALQANTSGSYNTADGAGALQSNNTGGANTAVGNAALANNNSGSGNTAMGSAALIGNTTGSNNTGIGISALQDNTTGGSNTAVGGSALQNNNGNNNTATGQNAMQMNTSGCCNTASGQAALFDNTTGSANAAFGGSALQDNSTGNNNVAIGQAALLNNNANNNTATGQNAMHSNTSGCCNTASGQNALGANTTGNGNAAFGGSALQDNTGGGGNTALGQGALQNNTTGASNIAIGQGAGMSTPVGNSNSIYIGSAGTGSDASGTIQIGTEGTQTGGTFIAGIYGASSSSGAEVYVNSSGQLGTVLSSGRFKEQITAMGDSSSKLLQLRPVNFFYKPEYDDGSHLLQYGLIAEEVAKVYPELVAYDKDGRIQTVQYQKLTPMLLNELQKLHIEAEEQNRRAQQQDQTIRQLEERLAAIEALIDKAPTIATARQ